MTPASDRPLTDPQVAVMGAMVAATRRRLAEGIEPDIPTSELTDRTGRVGQVVGHSCGRLVERGFLTNEARATYRLTRAGIRAWAGATREGRTLERVKAAQTAAWVEAAERARG